MRFTQKSIALLSTGALLAAIAVAVPSTSSAANLSSGSTAYVVNGQEETFTFDPVQRQGGTLLPLELFQRFGVEVEGATGQLIKLTEGSTTINLTLGRKAIRKDGIPATVAVEPVRLSGRLFLPAELLREFGVEFSQESGYVFLREFVTGRPTVTFVDQAAYSSLKSRWTSNPAVKLDSGQYAQSSFTLLNKELLQMDKLPVSLGARARLQGLAETNTLVLVDLQNYASKSGSLQTGGLFMIDQNRNQYDVLEEIDLGEGLLSAKLAPGADRLGVLVFPLLKPNPGIVKLYLDANGGDLLSWQGL